MKLYQRARCNATYKRALLSSVGLFLVLAMLAFFMIGSVVPASLKGYDVVLLMVVTGVTMPHVSKQTLDKLKEQRDKLNARIQLKEAGLKHSERKIDTRKKILVGAYFLDTAIKDNKVDEIKSMMDTYLKRNSDRALFELEPLVEG